MGIKWSNFDDLMKAFQSQADSNYKTSQDQLNWAKQTYADNKKVGDQVIDFALGQMDKEAAWADDDRKRYEDIYQPLEDQAAARAQDYATPERQEHEAGKAEADVAVEFDRARRAARDRLEAYGVDPSQVRQGALDLGTRVAQGAAEAGAGNQARFRTEQYGDQLMANAINTGKGYAQQVLGEAGAAGASGNQSTNTGLATTASGANTMGTGTTWSGLGTSALSGASQTLNAKTQNKLAENQAKQSESSGWGAALGTVASFFLEEGGAIPDDPMEGRSIPVEASPSAGAIPDDIDAEIEGGQPAKLNAGEFVIPKDVVSWLGEKGMQQFIMKARKEMGDPNQAPAQPETGGPPGQPPIPPRGVGAIPEMEGAM